jgi:hypothetical protein
MMSAISYPSSGSGLQPLWRLPKPFHVDNFYQANVDVNKGRYAGRVVNPAYWLVDSNRWNEMDSRLTGGVFGRSLGEVQGARPHELYRGFVYRCN